MIKIDKRYADGVKNKTYIIWCFFLTKELKPTTHLFANLKKIISRWNA